MPADYVTNYWQRLRERLEFKGRTHDFRHTFITRMLLRGHSPAVVAKLVGHTSTQMIDKNYGHLYRQHREDLVEAIRGGKRPATKSSRNLVKFPRRAA